jgi:hypothetical protein
MTEYFIVCFLLKIKLLPELKCEHQMQLIARGFDWVVKFVSISLLGCTSVSS